MQTKILWWIRLPSGNRALVLRGIRIGDERRFRQTLGAGSVVPSVVTIPSPGCWRVTVTNGRASARFVFRALRAPG
jgi:hypothetical protein